MAQIYTKSHPNPKYGGKPLILDGKHPNYAIIVVFLAIYTHFYLKFTYLHPKFTIILSNTTPIINFNSNYRYNSILFIKSHEITSIHLYPQPPQPI